MRVLSLRERPGSERISSSSSLERRDDFDLRFSCPSDLDVRAVISVGAELTTLSSRSSSSESSSSSYSAGSAVRDPLDFLVWGFGSLSR